MPNRGRKQGGFYDWVRNPYDRRAMSISGSIAPYGSSPYFDIRIFLMADDIADIQ